MLNHFKWECSWLRKKTKRTLSTSNFHGRAILTAVLESHTLAQEDAFHLNLGHCGGDSSGHDSVDLQVEDG